MMYMPLNIMLYILAVVVYEFCFVSNFFLFDLHKVHFF